MTERTVPVFKPDASHKGESITRMLSFSIIQLANPWIAVHNGSIRDFKGLNEWELTIPQYECNCRRFYAEWKANNPPDFTSPEAFFAWGVKLHNAVNTKLGKQQITIKEAYFIWRKTDGLDKQEDIAERS